jgi:hypothetical protein
MEHAAIIALRSGRTIVHCAPKDREGLRRKRNDMFASVLGSGRGQAQDLRVEINLASHQAPDLFAALAGEQEQPDHVNEGCVLAGEQSIPKQRNLLRRKNALA